MRKFILGLICLMASAASFGGNLELPRVFSVGTVSADTYFLDFRRQRGIMKRLTMGAPIRPTAMLCNANRHVDDFDLLHDARCLVDVFESATAEGTRLPTSRHASFSPRLPDDRNGC